MIGLACVLFLDLALFLVMPWWVVALLVVAWVVLFAVACRWWTAYPRRMLWPAVAGVALWVLVVAVGAVVA
jgi:hypothetical protein